MTPRRRERTAARRALRRLTTTMKETTVTTTDMPTGAGSTDARQTAVALAETWLRDDEDGQHTLIPPNDEGTIATLNAAVRLAGATAARLAQLDTDWRSTAHPTATDVTAAVLLHGDGNPTAALLVAGLDPLTLLAEVTQYGARLLLAQAVAQGVPLGIVLDGTRAVILSGEDQQ